MARRTSHLLATVLAGAGVAHALRPEIFDGIVPRALPGPARAYTYASGAAELAVAGLLALPRTRRTGGAAAAALFVAVFPANVQMAVDWRARPAGPRAVAYGRLPLQGLLVAQGVHVARGGRGALVPCP